MDDLVLSAPVLGLLGPALVASDVASCRGWGVAAFRVAAQLKP